MKFNLRPALWFSALAIVITLCGSQQSAALPLPQGGQNNGGHDDRNGDFTNNRHYQDGLRDGQEDRANHRDHQYRQNFGNDDNDRRAYEAGYNQGYQQNDGGRDRNDSNWDRDGHGHGHDHDSFQNPGARMGFQDGTNDGQSDRTARRKFKYGKGYRHPDRGYVSSYGDKQAYEQQYREAYEKAYQESYSGHDR